jgi:3-keto-5-aminohexanoate cleavage enzyme
VDKLIITAAIVGAELTPAQMPALPVTARQIGEAAEECCEAGASIIHLHVRDGAGNPSQAVDDFANAVDEIRRRCDVIVQFSTGGAVGTPIELRAAPLRLAPEMATLTTGTVNFGDDVFMNDLASIEYLAKQMRVFGVMPEIECFDVGHIANAVRLAERGLIDMPLYFDFVMGVPGGIPGTLEHLMHCVRSIPQGSKWQVAGIGRAELPLAIAAIIMGGNVRVGFEDNVYYSRGVLATDNAQLVARVARVSKEAGRQVATPSEARQILGIPPRG